MKITVSRKHENIIRFEVKDTGVGIDKCNIKELFKNFSKIKEDRAMNMGGCGLGLTISKNIAKALGGDIKVKSSVKGKGTIFVCRITEMEKVHTNKLRQS